MGVTVISADGSAEQAQARRVFDEVWPGDSTQVTSNLLRAILHAGGYCSVAVDDESAEVVGAAFGFLGQHEGTTYLHSHMAATVSGQQDRGIGTLLKRHQREWALLEGIPVVSWTFDPLVRRNAWLNIIRLGVRVTDFHPNFYGVMNDAINAGERTDRLVAWWEVDSDLAHAAAAGPLTPMRADTLRQMGAVDIVASREGVPVVGETAPAAIGLVALPEDILAVRRADRELSSRWRSLVGDALLSAYERGEQVVGFTDEASYVVADPMLVKEWA